MVKLYQASREEVCHKPQLVVITKKIVLISGKN